MLNIAVGVADLSARTTSAASSAAGRSGRRSALNGLAYLLWAVFGVGLGVLIRSQIGATVTGDPALPRRLHRRRRCVIILLADRFGDWINNLQVLVPPLASQLMVTGTDLPGNPARWVGAVVLIGYAVVTGAIGTALLRKRDIS